MDDYYFIVEVNLLNEGIDRGDPHIPASFDEENELLSRLAQFADSSLRIAETEIYTCPKYAFISENIETKEKIGLVMFLFRDMNDPTFQHFGIYDKFERSVFPVDGRICEIFQLWVEPKERRKGIASKLMNKAEEISRIHNIKMIYTHTESNNTRILEMRKKLGYENIRTGTLWDEIIRVSAAKYLI
ncbi:GNAT family N-acetyltransferase [Chloroflexota bacterium]